MIPFIEMLASYAGPAAILTFYGIWVYVGIKKDKFFTMDYMIYFPTLLHDYKEITKRENGRIGILYYIFITLVVIAFISILISAVL